MLVCALFFAASTLAPVLHHHEGPTAAHEGGCAACAWHHHAHVDVPPGSIVFEIPEVPLQGFEEFSLVVSSSTASEYFGRGPPLFS